MEFFRKNTVATIIVAVVVQVAATVVLMALLAATYPISVRAENTAVAFAAEPSSEAGSSRLDSWSFLLNPDRNYVYLVNRDNPYTFGGDYDQTLQADLVYITDDVYMDRSTDLGEMSALDTPEALAYNSVRVEKAAYFAYTRLKAELKADYNVDIGLLGSTAGYRVASEQQQIYDVYGGVLPGFSDHHTGLTLSIVFLMPGENGTSTAVVPTQEFAREHPDLIQPFLDLLPENGFIVRFPPNKESYTGVPGIYRDIRFVGSSSRAKLLVATDSCLEEYISGRGA
ncbi:hypothetical protein IJH89_00040 [Candidatus Saccharibacteria bacterium]|nr:hypothetical protein [Candidatus Saccharibacteria bacterium]